MQWWEARLTVSKEAADAVATLLHEFPEVQGVALEGAVESAPQHPEYGEWFSEHLTNEKDVTVTVYFPEHVSSPDIRERVKEVLTRVQAVGLDILQAAADFSLQLVDETSWENAWKEHFHPIPIGERFLIVPKWEQESVASAVDNRLPIVLEPGMAFGTGTHETTQMCLQAMENIALASKRVLDVGCGTAVLSIGAALCGAASVTAVDIDPVAVQVAQQNIADNGFSEVVHAIQGDLLSGFAEGEVFDVAFANILRDVVILLAPQVYRRLSPGGVFVSSGYIESQAPMVQSELGRVGFRVTDRLTKGDWVTLVAVKQP